MIESNYDLNEHDHELNNLDYNVDHDFIDLIDLDLTDLDLTGLDQDNFGRIGLDRNNLDHVNLDQIDQDHEIDQIDHVVEIDFQSISIDLHREMSLSSKIV